MYQFAQRLLLFALVSLISTTHAGKLAFWRKDVAIQLEEAEAACEKAHAEEYEILTRLCETLTKEQKTQEKAEAALDARRERLDAWQPPAGAPLSVQEVSVQNYSDLSITQLHVDGKRRKLDLNWYKYEGRVAVFTRHDELLGLTHQEKKAALEEERSLIAGEEKSHEEQSRLLHAQKEADPGAQSVYWALKRLESDSRNLARRKENLKLLQKIYTLRGKLVGTIQEPLISTDDSKPAITDSPVIVQLPRIGHAPVHIRRDLLLQKTTIDRPFPG